MFLKRAHIMRKKKEKIKKRKLLLETSVQIGKFIPDPKGNLLDKLPKDNDLYSSYFVLYEFKVGLIRNLIDFYYLVKLYDSPSKAIGRWSQKFGNRELKNKIVLEALMTKMYSSISTHDTKKYLRLVEGVIYWLIINFDTEIKGMVGDFGSDTIAKSEIRTNSDYQDFLKKYNNRKGCIPLDKFWSKHVKELKLFIDNKTEFSANENLKKIYKKLVDVYSKVENANKYTINKTIGDAVIATDSPKQFVITTLDRSFDVICKVLQKEKLNLLD